MYQTAATGVLAAKPAAATAATLFSSISSRRANSPSPASASSSSFHCIPHSLSAAASMQNFAPSRSAPSCRQSTTSSATSSSATFNCQPCSSLPLRQAGGSSLRLRSRQLKGLSSSVRLQKAESRPFILRTSAVANSATPATFSSGDEQDEEEQLPPVTVNVTESSSQPPTAHDVPGFTARRLMVFASIVFGYSSYYITRNSLTFTAPAMVAAPELGLDITAIGVITSIFPMFYGFSKFLSGVVSQKASSRIMLAGGLFMTGVINFTFGFQSSLAAFSVLWALNGLLQGFGAPSCAKILTSWFATPERGTYWGMWNIAHNLGGFSAPIIAGTCARNFGWRWGLITPGIIGMTVGALLLFTVKDSPEDAGYPPVEYASSPLRKPSDSAYDASGEKELGLVENLFKNVLSNPFIWGLALTYFFVYLVRQGVTSWSVFYLMSVKGATDPAAAAVRVSGLELGGLFGSLVAGFLSDKLAASSKGGKVGKRLQVVIAYMFGIVAMLSALTTVPASATFAQIAIFFFIGFFLYGPQMLIGLCGAELVGRKSVGASEGFLGWIAYLGAANAGVPLSIIVKKYGWTAFFSTLYASCGLGVLLLLPMINAKSFVEKEQEAAATAALA